MPSPIRPIKESDVDNVARIVLGLETHDVAEEVMHYLDRTGRARVVGTAADERQLAEAVRQLEPDAVVASPQLAGSVEVDGASLLALDTKETVASLRSALRAGASGYFLWPDERELLAGAASRVRRPPPASSDRRATVIAVYGPRGGAGATFLATHLAAAFARRDLACVLVDMDPLFADVTAAIGVPAEEPTRTVADLLGLMDELSPAHLEEVLWRHEEGFRALLAPEPADWPKVGAREYAATLDAVAGSADVEVLHLPRAIDDIARTGLDVADRVVLVLTLDVLGFRDAKRALAVMQDLGLEGRCDLVVNRAGRAEITSKDVRRVFGCEPLAVVPADGDARVAQDHGRLLPKRGKTARVLDRLASDLLEPAG